MADIALDQIEVQGVSYIHIEQISIRNYANQHAQAEITLQVDEKNGREFVEKSYEEEMIKVLAQGSVIFCGLIQKVSFKYDKSCTLLLFRLVSTSILWDIQKSNKSYQQIGSSLTEIINQSIGSMGIIENYGKDINSEAMIVQYQETNWQFVLRISAYMNLPVFVDATSEQPRATLGLNIKGKCVKYITYILTGGVLKISQLEEDASRLIPVYTSPPYIGKIFKGIVKSVKRADIRVWIPELDDNFDEKSTTWFPYSTAYSSQLNEAGFHCMPLKDEPVRVFLPSEALKDVFSSSGPAMRGIREDSEERCFSTPEGVSVLFGKDGLYISCKDYSSFIQLNKDGTIVLASSKSIGILSNTNVNIAALDGAVMLGAGQEIELVTPGSYISMGKKDDENNMMINMYASQIYVG